MQVIIYRSILLFFLLSCNISPFGLISSRQSIDHFKELNDIFIDNYQQARRKVLKTLHPIIISTYQQLTFLHRGENRTVNIPIKSYNKLKTIGHISLEIFVSVFDPIEKNRNLSSEELTSLRSYLKKIHAICKLVNKVNFPFTDEIIETQIDFSNLNINYLRLIIRSEFVQYDVLENFVRETEKLFKINLHIAVREQLDQLHALVYSWYTKILNETERTTRQVLILGRKTTRLGQLESQYFTKLLGGDDVEGQRLTYAENIQHRPMAFDILGTWFLDLYIANAFFNDGSCLHRDIFMDEAAQYVDLLFL